MLRYGAIAVLALFAFFVSPAYADDIRPYQKELVGDATSPNFSGFSLPAFPGVTQFKYSLLVNGTWQPDQFVVPGSIIQSPAGNTGIRYLALDANGKTVVLPVHFTFGASFATTGKFNGSRKEYSVDGKPVEVTEADKHPSVLQSTAGFPKGYLVPTAASIPEGFKPNDLLNKHPEDNYVLEYSTADNGAKLIFSEYPNNAQMNFEKTVSNVNLMIVRPLGNMTVEKVKDFEHLGARGVLYHIKNYNSSSYDLYMDDNGKLVRIQANDGTSFHFTPDTIDAVINGLARQN